MIVSPFILTSKNGRWSCESSTSSSKAGHARYRMTFVFSANSPKDLRPAEKFCQFHDLKLAIPKTDGPEITNVQTAPRWGVQNRERLYPSIRNPVGAFFGLGEKQAYSMFVEDDLPYRVFSPEAPSSMLVPKTFCLVVGTPEVHGASFTLSIDIWSRGTKDGLTLKDVLEPYRFHLNPVLEYVPDNRHIVQFASADPSWVTDDNPFGFNGSNRRLDAADGGDRVWKWVGKAIEEDPNAGSFIVWVPGGSHPRGANYRPDILNIPMTCQDSLRILGRRFKSVRLGVLLRPTRGIVELSRYQSLAVPLDLTSSAYLRYLKTVLEETQAWGVRSYYLDEVGGEPEHLHLLQIMRKLVPNSTQFFSEFGTDRTLRYSGLYTEYLNPNFRWMTWTQMSALRVLWPDAPIIVKDRDGKTGNWIPLGSLNLSAIVDDYLYAIPGFRLQPTGERK